jgi:hypothetical protein
MCFSVALINNFLYVENELSCVGKAIALFKTFINNEIFYKLPLAP